MADQKKNYTVDGERYDGEYGLPLDFFRCPGCGKTYKKQKKACLNCEECVKCCTCKEPKIVSADEIREAIAEKS